jgi:hypothetical protein
LRKGCDVALLCLGSRLGDALAAADELETVGISVTIADARFAKPIDAALVRDLACSHQVLVTIEEGASGGDLPSFDAAGDISLLDALVGLGFVASKKEGRRMIQGGGARVDGDAVTADDAVISAQAAAVKISAGQKKHGLINFV